MPIAGGVAGARAVAEVVNTSALVDAGRGVEALEEQRGEGLLRAPEVARLQAEPEVAQDGALVRSILKAASYCVSAAASSPTSLQRRARAVLPLARSLMAGVPE